MCVTLVSNILTYISIHSKVVAYKRRTTNKIKDVFIGINKWLDNIVEPKEDPIEKFYKSLGNVVTTQRLKGYLLLTVVNKRVI